MALLDTFSRRKRRAAGSEDVYQYGIVSDKLRIQIIHIFREGLGDPSNHPYQFNIDDSYKFVVETMRKEKGVFSLSNGAHGFQRELFSWITDESDVDELMDGVELTLRVIDTHYRNNWSNIRHVITLKPDDAIEEFNGRCREDGFGVQYVDGALIEMSSTILHAEVVVEALKLTSVREFESVNKEYHEAHKAYREGGYETCLTECGKAFESTLKIIGKSRSWAIAEGDSATKLLEAAYKADFIPAPMQAEFTALRAVLSAGVPTIRNKMAAHGAGSAVRNIPRHLAAFQLHQCAAAILFLIENHTEVA